MAGTMLRRVQPDIDAIRRMIVELGRIPFDSGPDRRSDGAT